MVPYIKASLLGLSGMAHYHLEVQANKKMAPKIDAILTCMGETGLSHDITSKISESCEIKLAHAH